MNSYNNPFRKPDAVVDAVNAVLEGKKYSKEGNAFGQAVTKAKKDGKKEFDLDGKKYKVTEEGEWVLVTDEDEKEEKEVSGKRDKVDVKPRDTAEGVELDEKKGVADKAAIKKLSKKEHALLAKDLKSLSSKEQEEVRKIVAKIMPEGPATDNKNFKTYWGKKIKDKEWTSGVDIFSKTGSSKGNNKKGSRIASKDELEKNESVEMNEKKAPRQLKDPKTETMVVDKKGKVEVIDKKDLKKYLKKGYGLAEEKDLPVKKSQ